LALLLVTTILAMACATTVVTQPPPDETVQTSEAGQVKVVVTWQRAAAVPTFTVAMETHTVELDGYDLRQLAVLQTDQGKHAQPNGWDAPKGGHHRSGTLTFPAVAGDGSLLLGPTTRELTLMIREVGAVPERVLRWVH
jgi:hypothetical protein